MSSLTWVASIGLETCAVFCIILGAHRSLTTIDKSRQQHLTSSEASSFPVVASCMLVGLFLAFRLVGTSLVNQMIGYYFLVFSCAGLYYFLLPMVRFRPVAGLLAVGLSAAYFFTRHWSLNNALAIALATSALEQIRIPSFLIGLGLEAGLFFFDIFWVFGTRVMIDVATKFDGPIKVTFPSQPFNMTLNDEGKRPMSLLGLGDIVVPGIFLAMLLHFDASRARASGQKTVTPVYFVTTLLAYVAAFLVTFVIGMATKHGQPALLYLVPAIVIAPIVTATLRGELGMLFTYVEPPPPEPEDIGELTWTGLFIETIGFNADAYRVPKLKATAEGTIDGLGLGPEGTKGKSSAQRSKRMNSD